MGNPGAGVPLALIGAFLASRTQKVRFVFDDEAMEVMTVGADGELALSGENFAVRLCARLSPLPRCCYLTKALFSLSSSVLFCSDTCHPPPHILIQVGGRNRWAYDTFTNWEFYPSPQLPILVYFKETQTSPEGACGLACVRGVDFPPKN